MRSGSERCSSSALLGLGRKLDPRRDRVGVVGRELDPRRAALRRRARPAQRTRSRVGVRLARSSSPGLVRRRRSARPRRRVVAGLEALENPERLLARDDDVHPAVVEALQHLGDPRGAADPLRACRRRRERRSRTAPRPRGSGRSSACSAPRRCGAAGARPAGSPPATRRSAAEVPPRLPWPNCTSGADGRHNASRMAIDFEAEGLLEGLEGAPARHGGSCWRAGAGRRHARGAARAPSRRTAWPCCRSSACSMAARGARYTARRSPRRPGSSAELLRRASAVHWACPTTRPGRRGGSPRGRPRGGEAASRRCSRRGSPQDGIVEVTASDGPGAWRRSRRPARADRGVHPARGRHRARGRARLATSPRRR